jgi:hypothetical protein
MSHPSQFTCCAHASCRFSSRSLGAFNDNIFKQSLILAILYK